MATTVTTSTIFTEAQAIPENSSRRYRAQLLDPDGNAVLPGIVQSIRFSLREASSNRVVNNRYRVEVRNVNGGTLSSAGVFSFVLQPQDTLTIGTAKMQKRRALFEVFFLAGQENHEVFFWVENLKDLPPALEGHPGDEVGYVGDDDGLSGGVA